MLEIEVNYCLFALAFNLSEYPEVEMQRDDNINSASDDHAGYVYDTCIAA